MACPQCGKPLTECGDPQAVWYPQRAVCYASMQQADVEARYAALHEAAPYHDGTFTSWATDRSVEHPFHYRDGVRLWLADEDYTPDDDFLGDAPSD
jgi:hypothetical protein